MLLRSRIAPTPSGYLHAGNAFNFLLTYHVVRQSGGSIRLRIDDLDTPRIRQEYITDVFDSLNWLGISWDEGPHTPEEHYRLYSQQLRLDRYHKYLDVLTATGKVFACSCSRQEIERNSRDGHYSGSCIGKGIPLDAPDTSLRIVIPDPCLVTIHDRMKGVVTVDLYRVMRHFVVRRRDGIPAYHLASLADDLDFHINCIVRGEDLLHSTAAQLYLASLLQEPVFSSARFYHHPLFADDDGRKLSKSAGSISLKHQRAAGMKPEMLSGLVASAIQQMQTPDQ